MAFTRSFKGESHEQLMPFIRYAIKATADAHPMLGKDQKHDKIMKSFWENVQKAMLTFAKTYKEPFKKEYGLDTPELTKGPSFSARYYDIQKILHKGVFPDDEGNTGVDKISEQQSKIYEILNRAKTELQKLFPEKEDDFDDLGDVLEVFDYDRQLLEKALDKVSESINETTNQAKCHPMIAKLRKFWPITDIQAFLLGLESMRKENSAKDKATAADNLEKELRKKARLYTQMMDKTIKDMVFIPYLIQG
jgi:hypothetical protein